MFRVVLTPIIRSAYNCIYSIWYFSQTLLLSAAIVEELEPVWVCCGWLRPPTAHSNGSNSSTIAADSSNGVTNTRCCKHSWCAPDDGWKYHPKHVEQFPDINKLSNFASCWIYEYIGILLGARPILHISRIKVKCTECLFHSDSYKIWCLCKMFAFGAPRKCKLSSMT
jgi:hypothetical protein